MGIKKIKIAILFNSKKLIVFKGIKRIKTVVTFQKTSYICSKLKPMRILKKIFLFSFIFLMFACKSDDEGNQFLLSYENLAGLYDLVYLNGNIETTIEIQGIPVTAVTIIEGSTFQVDATFNQNGTYSLEGEYLVTITTTAGGSTETDSEIIVVDDTGTFQIDANEQTITITSSVDELDGTFDVTLFNENQLRLVQEESYTEGDASIDSIIEVRFVRQ
jgi:hypothetical protein